MPTQARTAVCSPCSRTCAERGSDGRAATGSDEPPAPPRQAALRHRAYLTGHGGDEWEVARAVPCSVRVVALAGVEEVQPVQPRAGRADGVSRERRDRTLVRDAVCDRMRGGQLVERVGELVRLRLLG